MQLSHRFALLALASALAGCKDTTAPEPAVDQIVAKWAGDVWIGSTTVRLYHFGMGGDSLSVAANRTGVPAVDETVIVRVPFTGTGTYQLGPGSAAFLRVGGDALTAEYVTTPSATGSLVITKYDPVAGMIEGVVSFNAVSTIPPGRYGNQAAFEDGRFRATVLDRAVP